MLTAKVIGPMEVEVDGEAVSLPPRSRQQRLFAYLLIHRGKNLDRSQVAGLLFPDTDEQGARRRLSDTLYLLKKALPESVLKSDSHSLGLHLGKKDRCDLVAFDGKLRDQELLTLNPMGLFEDLEDAWALSEREALRNRLLDALEGRGNVLLQQGRAGEAQTFFARLVELEPLGEEPMAGLMNCLRQAGRSADALREFRSFSKRLEEELGALPSGDILELARSLEGAAPAAETEARLAQELPLVGRSREHKQLTGLLDHSLKGRGAVVLVEGEPGIGKSRLLEEFIKDAGWRSLQVGACKPVQGQLLGPALAGLLTPLKAEHLSANLPQVWLKRMLVCLPDVQTLFADLEPAAENLDPEVQGETLRRVLQSLSRLGPLVLVLEDLHDASLDALEQLKFLAPHLEDCQVLVALSYRPGPMRDDPRRWSILQSLDTLTVTHRLELQPLERRDIGSLLGAALGLAPDNTVAAMHRSSGGNPLVLLEQAASLLEQGALQQEAEGWSLRKGATDELVSGQAKQAIGQRLGGLDPEARQLLVVSTVDQEPMGFRLLGQLTGFSQPQVLALSRQLVHRRLWREEGTGFTPAHDLIRETVQDHLSAEEHRELHRHFVDVLQADGAQAQRLGQHAHAAGLWELAADALSQASENLQRQGQYHGSLQLALLAQDALEKTPGETDPNRQLRLLFRLQRLCAWTHRREEQESLIHRLEKLADRANRDAPLVSWARAEWTLERGNQAEALALIEEGIHDPNIGAHPLALAHLHRLGAKASQAQGDPDAFRRHLQEAERLAVEHGLMEVQLAVAILRAIHHHYGGELALARDEYREVQTLAEKHGLVLQALDALSNQGAVEQGLGNEMAAIAAYEKAIEGYGAYAARDPKDLDNLAFLYIFVGRVEDARKTLAEARRLWEKKDDRAGLSYNTCMGGWLELELRNLAAARPRFEEAFTLGTEAKFLQTTSTSQLTMGLVAHEEGRFEDSRRWYSEAQAAFDGLGVTFYNGYLSALRAKDAALAGDSGQAESFFAEAEKHLQGTLQATRARLGLAKTAHALGLSEKAEDYFRQAGEMIREKAASLPAGVRESFLNLPRNLDAEMGLKRLEEPERVVTLAFCGAPTGRALKEYEQVPVWWPSLPDLRERGLTDRGEQILELCRLALAQDAGVAVADLAAALEVSPATISRTLKKLRSDGHILPTRGS